MAERTSRNKPSQTKPGAPGSPQHRAGAQRRLRAVRPTQVLFFVMFLALGLAASASVRTHTAEPLAGLSNDQLVGLLSDLKDKEEDLREQRRDLQEVVDELKRSDSDRRAAAEASENLKERAELAAGVLPVSGPGVELYVPSTAAEAGEPLPVALFVTTLAEMRNAGAEAISLNGIRLTGRSWFGPPKGGSPPGAIIVDGEQITPPFNWKAIGEPETLAMALEIRGGVTSQFKAYGVEVLVHKREDLSIASTANVEEAADPKVGDD